MKWLFLFLSSMCGFAGIPLERQAAFFAPPVAGAPAPPSGGTYTFLGATNADVSGGGTASVVFNPTGAKLIVISCCNYASSGSDSGPSDGVNTYRSGNINGGHAGQVTNQLFYCTNIVSSGAITVSCVRFYTVLAIAWYSYSGATPIFDTQAAGFGSQVGAGNTTFPTGNATPSLASALAVTGFAWGAGPTATIDSSFTIRKQLQQGGNNLFGAIADKTVTATTNPTWSGPSSGDGGCNLMLFY